MNMMRYHKIDIMLFININNKNITKFKIIKFKKNLISIYATLEAEIDNIECVRL